MVYIDAMIAAVPNANRKAYKTHSVETTKLIKEFGALEVVDCWGDDVPEGKVTSMPMAVQAKDDETVAFSYIVWPTKEVRDAGMHKMMTDPRMSSMDMPFDGKRLIFGGFKPLSES